MQDHPEPDPTEGLVKKYDVTRVDGDPTGKHADCAVFVLDPKHDKKARTALLAYAQEAARDGEDQLAVDIIEWVGRLELADHHPQLLDSYDREFARRKKVASVEREVVTVEAADGFLAEKAPSPRLCPIHHQPDCSPLLNGCSELTKGSGAVQQDFPMEGVVIREPGDGSPLDGLLDHFGVQGTFVVPPIENKGGYSMHVDPTDGKRI